MGLPTELVQSQALTGKSNFLFMSLAELFYSLLNVFVCKVVDKVACGCPRDSFAPLLLMTLL